MEMVIIHEQSVDRHLKEVESYHAHEFHINLIRVIHVLLLFYI